MRTPRPLLLGAVTLGIAGCGSHAATTTPPPPAPPAPNPAQAELTSHHYLVALRETGEAGGDERHGSAIAMIAIRPGGDRLCWQITDLAGVPAPLFVVIDRGAVHQSGPIVIALGRRYQASGCASTVAPVLLNRIEINPRGYYLTLTDRQHPTGSIRGQL